MKKVISLLMIFLVLFTITGCNNQKEEENKEEVSALPMEISQEDWANAKQFVDLSTGIKMAYVEMGDPNGEVIILQHGMTDNSRSWSFAAPFFAKAGYHVYLPDLRGMGLSDAPDGYYSPITYATDLEAFFDAMNIEKATLVGHSLGSFTVQAFSIMFPERCNNIVLVSSIPLNSYQNNALVYIYESQLAGLKEDEHLSDAFMDFWYATVLHDDAFADEFDTFIANMKNEAQALSKKAWKNIVLGLATINMNYLYFEVDHDVPVLLMHGSDDAMTKGDYQEELIEIFDIDENSYIEYEGIGHNIQFEIPTRCANDILTWLATGSVYN